MIIGVGIDILNLARLRVMPPKRLHRLSTRILTENELSLLRTRLGSDISTLFEAAPDSPEADAMGKENLITFLGVRWAAKEALYKAVYPHRALTWKDVELLPLGGIDGSNTTKSTRSTSRAASNTDQFFSPSAERPLLSAGRTSSKLQARFTTPVQAKLQEAQHDLMALKAHVSVSHDGGAVIAMAVVEGE